MKTVTREFSDLVGQTLSEISGMKKNSGQITITTDEGRKYRFLHHQGCCESVCVVDVAGDPADLLNSPIVEAEEVTLHNESPEEVMGLVDTWESFTWTFYKFTTNKGTVTVRWLGESNGYYGEEVDFEEILH